METSLHDKVNLVHVHSAQRTALQHMSLVIVRQSLPCPIPVTEQRKMLPPSPDHQTAVSVTGAIMTAVGCHEATTTTSLQLEVCFVSSRALLRVYDRTSAGQFNGMHFDGLGQPGAHLLALHSVHGPARYRCASFCFFLFFLPERRLLHAGPVSPWLQLPTGIC